MSGARASQEQEESVSTLRGTSDQDEDSTTPPITASEIYHAALANTRTLDLLLASFDKEKTSTDAASCVSVSKIGEDSTQGTNHFWTRAESVPRSLESSGADTERPLDPDILSNVSGPQRIQVTAPLVPEPGTMLRIGTPSVLRHRSPVPSMSSTTPLSSLSPASSAAFEAPANEPVATNESQAEAPIPSAARCTVCDRNHSDPEQSPSCNLRSKVAEYGSPYRTVPQGRQSGIPRRSGRFMNVSQCRSPH